MKHVQSHSPHVNTGFAIVENGGSTGAILRVQVRLKFEKDSGLSATRLFGIGEGCDAKSTEAEGAG